MDSLHMKIVPQLLLAVVLAAVPGLAAAQGPTDQAMYQVLEKFHGHVCAGSLFGARLGETARQELRAAGGEGKLKARYYDLSCPVDGIQVAAGTTYGNGAITVEDRDQHRLVLTAEKSGKQVEARLTVEAEEMGLRSRELGKKARALTEGSPGRKLLEAEIEKIYNWLRTAPSSEVVALSTVRR